MTQQPINLSELSPEQRWALENGELSAEAIQARGELHKAWDDTLYGSLESDGGEIAVEDLNNRVNESDVRAAMDIEKQPNLSHIENAVVSENAAMRNTHEAVQMTQQTMSQIGIDGTVPQRAMMSRIVGEQLSDGTTEHGDLYQEDKRDVAEAMVVQQFAVELDNGNTEVVDRLPPSTAVKVMTQLWWLRNKYGEVSRIPNDELVPLGEMIMQAEKVAPSEETEPQPDAEAREPQSQDESLAEARRLVEQAHEQLAA